MVPWPVPNNPDVCKVSLIFQRDQRTAVNTFHVDKAGGWSLGDLNALHTVVLGWWTSFYKNAVCAADSLVQIQYRVLNPLIPLALDVAISPAQPGALPGPAEAANVSATISWRTGLAGRRFRGRIYNPAIAEASVSADDRINSTLVANMSAAATQLISLIFAFGAKLVIFHRPGLIPKPWDNAVEQVLSFVVENILDSMRRRLPSRGR